MPNITLFDKIIIGAGFYGLFAALYCGKKKQKVLVLEHDAEPFMRASFVNQARVHMGYHYPRSYSTAIKSAGYFNRFVEDYDFCINKSFRKIYAIPKAVTWTNASEFHRFCRASDIMCEPISPECYFQENLIEGAFLTTEYAFDAQLLRDFLIKEIS